MPFLLPRSLVRTAPFTQGHVEAAALIGDIYYWGKGVAVDYERALAGYKIGAEGGDASCQNQLGSMSEQGKGIDSPDYEQALMWYEKAAAQDHAIACNNLGVRFREGRGQASSWRRARELYQRAIKLGCAQAIESAQVLTESIADVSTSPLLSPLPPPPHPPHLPFRSAPSWTSGS